MNSKCLEIQTTTTKFAKISFTNKNFVKMARKKFSYISHKGIYKKIFFSRSKSKIFISKADFGQIAMLAKLLYRWPWQPQLLIFFNTNGKMKIGQIRAKSGISNMDFHLHCKSETGGWPHAQTGGRGPKIFCVGYPPI